VLKPPQPHISLRQNSPPGESETFIPTGPKTLLLNAGIVADGKLAREIRSSSDREGDTLMNAARAILSIFAAAAAATVVITAFVNI
jgi:hypothetical protein